MNNVFDTDSCERERWMLFDDFEWAERFSASAQIGMAPGRGVSRSRSPEPISRSADVRRGSSRILTARRCHTP
jgi:hypothetical protein